MTLTAEKLKKMQQLSTKDGIISALAIDQRGAMKKMMAQAGVTELDPQMIETFKGLVSEELTPFASAILLDPEYGRLGAEKREETTGLLLAYEQTGYDTTVPGRLPDLIPEMSAKRIKEAGAEAVKFLLYYDFEEDEAINQVKQAFVERIGSECRSEEMPFYLELLSYDQHISDNNSQEFAMKKPAKVLAMMEEFSKDRYNVDVLKVEVPVNMAFVEGFAKGPVIHTQAEASALFKAQSVATNLPFIFLSAGVSAALFQDTLRFAKAGGSTFNGVLCGRATWAAAVEIFVKEGEAATRHWLQTTGRQNMESLNQVLAETASSWFS